MIPRNSDIHRRRLTEIIEVTDEVKGWLWSLPGKSSSFIPPRTIRETNDPYISDSDDEDGPGSFLTDPTTSGRIRLQSAVGIVYRFASTLPDDSSASLFRYDEAGITEEGRPLYTCTVRLPGDVAVPPISSFPSISIAHARRMACYLLCKELFQRGLLDYPLVPRPFDSAALGRHTVNETGFLDPDDADATASLPPKGANQNASGTRCYPAKTPDFWKNVLTAPSERLYPTVIYSDAGSGMAPLVIITRMPLPPFADFNLFDRGMEMRIHLQRGRGFDTDEHQRHLLWRFTTRIIRTIQNKPFACEQERTPYFLAPLRKMSRWASRFGLDGEVGSDDVWNLPTVSEDIPWDLIEEAGNNFIRALRMESVEALQEDMEDAVIQDRWIEFTRRYFVAGVRTDLTPLSKPEPGIVSIYSPQRNLLSFLQREEAYDTYLAYVAKHRHNFEGIQKHDQPIIEVARVLPVQNHLHPTYKHVAESTKMPTKCKPNLLA
jgi:endoribonuclease Dicer